MQGQVWHSSGWYEQLYRNGWALMRKGRLAEEKDLDKDQESSFWHINFDTFKQSKWKCERDS